MQDIELFEAYLTRKGLRSSTVAFRIYCLKTLLSISDKLTPTDLEKYLLAQFKLGRRGSYLNQLIHVMRAWGDFKDIEELKRIKFFKVEKSNKATLSDAEIEAFLKLPPGDNVNKRIYHRMTLFFKIFAYSGMRGGEVATLTINQIDFGKGVFDLTKTKTSPRLVPIQPILIDELKKYISSLITDRLFPRLNGSKSWRVHFHSRIKRLNIKRENLTPHSLRHSFITRMLSEDINMAKVQRIVGHKDISTTNQYTHLVTKDLVEAIKKDPLSRQSLPYADRFRHFREGVRKLLEDFAGSVDEEKQMIYDLSKS